MVDCSLGANECVSVDGHSSRCVGCLPNTSEGSNIPQGKYIIATKHYWQPQGVWVTPKPTFHRIPEGFPSQYGSYQKAQRWVYIKKVKFVIFAFCWLQRWVLMFLHEKNNSESLKGVFCVSTVKFAKTLLKKLIFVKKCSKAFCVDVDPHLDLLVGAIL